MNRAVSKLICGNHVLPYNTIVVFLLFLSQTAFAIETVIVDQVTSIYDGDTFRANIQNWPQVIGHRIPIRIKSIDTPEIRGKCKAEKTLARQAKQFTVQTLRSANKIELRNLKRGKFFRIIADVYADGKSLGDELILRKLAVEYSGGKKFNWCK